MKTPQNKTRTSLEAKLFLLYRGLGRACKATLIVNGSGAHLIKTSIFPYEEETDASGPSEKDFQAWRNGIHRKKIKGPDYIG